MRLGIIGAMDVEIAALKQAMEEKEEQTPAGMEVCLGTLEGLPVAVARCGVGKVNAALCVQILRDLCQVTHVVNTGIAGSLDPKLDIGDLVVSSDAMYHDFSCTVFGYSQGQVPGFPAAFPADGELCRIALEAAEEVYPGHARMGRIASGDQFVCGTEQKERISDLTEGLCTEMEGAAIAQAAYRNNLPFVILRAISDKADNSAEMDYPSFEAAAAKRCAAVTMALAKRLGAAYRESGAK